jgi:2-phospho-L-lactate guanylyltransferase
MDGYPPGRPGLGQDLVTVGFVVLSAAVLVPVKAFTEAKGRLAAALPGPERARLAEAMAERVLAACGGLPTAVVCDDERVAEWAVEHGAQVVWEPGRGLNGAVEAGVAWLAAKGVARVVVAHADLPRAAGLAALAAGEGVTLVPDQREDGTNVATIPSMAGFRFAYGPGSFARHRTEAARLGLALTIVHDPLLAYDVDVPTDLAGLAGTGLE